MGNVFSWYTRVLQESPFIVKPLSSCVLYGVGDLLSQCIEGTIKSGFLFLRFLRMAIWGIIYGLIVTVWYNTLDLIPIENKYLLAIVKVLLDQLIVGPCVNYLMFIFISLLETCKDQPKTAFHHANDLIIPTLKVNYCIWPFVQIINFLFIPLDYQVLVVNIVSIFWTTFLSYIENSKKRKNLKVEQSVSVEISKEDA